MPSIKPYIQKSSQLLTKSATTQKIKLIQKNLGNLRKKGESREAFENSLSIILQKPDESHGRNVAHTFEERVKLFETDIEKKDKQAKDFVKKM